MPTTIQSATGEAVDLAIGTLTDRLTPAHKDAMTRADSEDGTLTVLSLGRRIEVNVETTHDFDYGLSITVEVRERGRGSLATATFTGRRAVERAAATITDFITEEI